MYSEFSLDSHELNGDFVKSIKKLFKGQRITITVSTEPDETAYLLSNEVNKARLLESIKNVENGAPLTKVDLSKLLNEASRDIV